MQTGSTYPTGCIEPAGKPALCKPEVETRLERKPTWKPEVGTVITNQTGNSQPHCKPEVETRPEVITRHVTGSTYPTGSTNPTYRPEVHTRPEVLTRHANRK